MIEKIIPKKIDFKKDIQENFDLLYSAINKKNVLVIGGAGTIGSNYIKEVLNYKPSILTVVDTNENGLTELTRDLRSSILLNYKPKFLTYPVNLLSETFDKIFNANHYDIVANFSALKHVRSEKDFISTEALIKNNVFGAIKLLKLCENQKPEYFFSVSTDKAANPVNIMGASKLLMEKIILSKKDKFRVSTARFANVAFSNGSLLQGFLKRIEKNQPLSCPNDIKRFFVTPKQSGQICLLSTFLGDTGNIFFPKLDFEKDQIYFKEIALSFLNFKNYKPYLAKSEDDAKSYKINEETYPIYFFGSDTSGEKKYEEFYDENDNYFLDKYHSIGYIIPENATVIDDEVYSVFSKVFSSNNNSKRQIIKALNIFIKNFNHIETGKNLDDKM